MARLAPAVPFGAKDGPADLVFFIAAPDGADQEHLKLLSRLARSLIKKDFTAALRAAATREDIVALVEGALADKPAASTGTTTAAPSSWAQPALRARHLRRLQPPWAEPWAATGTDRAGWWRSPPAPPASPTPTWPPIPWSPPHKEAGVDLQVETQGSGAVTPLDPAVIAAAEAVIFAVDVDVRGKERFAGKPVINAPVKRGIDEPAKMVQEALAAATDPHAHRVPHFGAEEAAERQSERANEHIGQKLKKALLTGVSYMIPFVAGGGLLIALGFLLGGL